jgi:hypothetical protein
MKQLPRTKYPGAKNTLHHGIQQLPPSLPLVNFGRAEKYRSNKYQTTNISVLEGDSILGLSRLIAKSFVEKEPMNRHLHPPDEVPAGLNDAVHKDPFGSHKFGAWTKENIFYWFIRLNVLTDSNSHKEEIPLNEDLIKLSLAVKGSDGALIGGAINITVNPHDEAPPLQDNHPIKNAIEAFIAAPLTLVMEQEHIALETLCGNYPSFRKALSEQKVGCHFMVARSQDLPSEDTFELVYSSVEKFMEMDYSYVIISGTNEWTGAACEILGGTRIHYAPYRDKKRVQETKSANKKEVHSIDGYLSDKDSGSMFYLIKLK